MQSSLGGPAVVHDGVGLRLRQAYEVDGGKLSISLDLFLNNKVD